MFPRDEIIDQLTAGTGEKVQASTTMAFTRLLRVLLKDPEFGPRVVPIIPDEARTFGMDALFAEFKIYSPLGQQYEPVDAALMLSYREATNGQLLEEGITEAGAMASFTAASTAYSTWGYPLIPFFIFYSMFGFQRVGDQIWAYGDQRGKGFLLGATAGRTTLTGEGLQHCDGQSLHYAMAVPNCRAYDPAFAYEVGVLVRDGIRRMYGDGGATKTASTTSRSTTRTTCSRRCPRASKTASSAASTATAPRPNRVRTARRSSRADRWCCTRSKRRRCSPSTTTSRPTCGACPAGSSCATTRIDVERWNRLHPAEPPRTPYVTEQLARHRGPDRSR